MAGDRRADHSATFRITIKGVNPYLCRPVWSKGLGGIQRLTHPLFDPAGH